MIETEAAKCNKCNGLSVLYCQLSRKTSRTKLFYRKHIVVKVVREVTGLLQAVMTYRSIHGTSPSYPYSCVAPALPRWHPDDSCDLLPHIVWKFRPFVSLQSTSGRFRFLVPPSETTCLSTSHLRRHSRFSDKDLSVFPFLPRHYPMTHVLLLPFVTTVWTPVVLAIINIIQATLRMFLMMMMMILTRASIVASCNPEKSPEVRLATIAAQSANAELTRTLASQRIAQTSV